MEKVKAVVFDLDGTLYIGETVVDKAIETLAILEGKGFQIFYMTNNSGKSSGQIVFKLNKLGFKVDVLNTYCGAYALAVYLSSNQIEPVYVIGTENLKHELQSHLVEVRGDAEVSAVVVGFDPNFSYKKIAMALEAIEKGAKMIVANTDASYPVEKNRRLPGCGAMVGAIVSATGYVPDFHVGKPNTYMLQLLCAEHNLLKEEICVVGDVPESDIAMAQNFGCQSILYDSQNAFPQFLGERVGCLSKIINYLK